MADQSRTPFFRYRHLLVLAIYPLYFWGFQYVEQAVPVAKYLMYTRADDFVPFVPLGIYPYLFWYLYIGLAVAYTGLTDAKGFLQLMLFLYIGMGVSYAIYLLFPNGQNLRPALASLGEGLHHDLIRWLYRVDTPTNSNPSMHVIDSMAVYLALRRTPSLAGRRWFQRCNLALNAVIMASTLLVKQHSVIDVFCALAFSWLLYLAIMRFELPFRLAGVLSRNDPMEPRVCPAGIGTSGACRVAPRGRTASALPTNMPGTATRAGPANELNEYVSESRVRSGAAEVAFAEVAAEKDK